MIDNNLNFQEEETPKEEEVTGQMEGEETGDGTEGAEEPAAPAEPSTEEAPAEDAGDDIEEVPGM